ncbi:Uncharacterised protein [Staphylococcus gallinarum]|uniref:Uncharacterized protein n=1 Tax=Staphylococcus gallinarum TaxID=1293 RepID=A0A380FB38_STAGA|nr:Uncharacterised protein [Staphylococcus gallinarum]
MINEIHDTHDDNNVTGSISKEKLLELVKKRINRYSLCLVFAICKDV